MQRVWENGGIGYRVQPHDVSLLFSLSHSNILVLIVETASCICRHQFCYVCNARWRTCTCPQFDEERLIERAEVVVARNPVDNQRPGAVAAMADHLRNNHVCQHERYRSIRGRNTCEGCDDVMPMFIYECRQCHVQMCRRCRNNRQWMAWARQARWSIHFWTIASCCVYG